jgi:hypothetical protein
MTTVHVDDDAADDPGPGSTALSDPCEDGTPAHPFDTIQEAVDVAVDGTSVLVQPGIYRETIDLGGRNTQLTGAGDANEAYPIIDADHKGPAVTFAQGEGPDCLLEGFVIAGGGLYCNGSEPTISHCLIVGNRAIGPGGAAVHCMDSNAVFVNCTIADNRGPEASAGIYLADSDPVLINTIVWGNAPHEILLVGDSLPAICYTTMAGDWPGPGNRADDPLFVERGYWDPNATPDDPNDDFWVEGDYHLKSEAGRWEPVSGGWIIDDVTSPCIDAGDPNSPVAFEPFPNGGIVNRGAYGGTSQASKSPVGIHTDAQE